jgi:hypothetical protein
MKETEKKIDALSSLVSQGEKENINIIQT